MHRTGEGLPDDWLMDISPLRAAVHLFTAFRSWVLVMALLLPCTVLAAGFSCESPANAGNRTTLDELEEVVITGEETTTETKDLRAWLGLLVGQFTYEGYVDLCGKGNAREQRPVTGKADCVGSGSTPNVHCTVNVRWPAARGENGAPVLGGVSSLQPASVIYTLESRYMPEKQLNYWGLMFMQVDNKGLAEWAAGTLVGDTFASREPCVDLPACQKTTRITARPDSNEIAMLVEVHIDNERVLRQTFLLHRESRSPTGGQSSKAP